MVEIEAKIRVGDHLAVRAACERNGGEFVGKYVETNWILDRAGGSLRAAGCGLRVREMEVLKGAPAGATLTYKGARHAGRLKEREEIEVGVGDAGAMLSLLEKVGFVTVLHYRKRRERWIVDGCRVELDEVPMLGAYVEIEGESEVAIVEVQGRLGLGGAPHEPASYVRLLLERCAAMGRKPADIGFESVE